MYAQLRKQQLSPAKGFELPAKDEQVDRCFSQGHSARDDKLLDAADAPYDQQTALVPA